MKVYNIFQTYGHFNFFLKHLKCFIIILCGYIFLKYCPAYYLYIQDQLFNYIIYLVQFYLIYVHECFACNLLINLFTHNHIDFNKWRTRFFIYMHWDLTNGFKINVCINNSGDYLLFIVAWLAPYHHIIILFFRI